MEKSKYITWGALLLVLILLSINIFKGCRKEENPAVSRLEERMEQVAKKLERDSIYVNQRNQEIVRLQDTVIYITEVKNFKIKEHDKEITRINYLNPDDLLLEVRSSIGYLDSLDKSQWKSIFSNPKK